MKQLALILFLPPVLVFGCARSQQSGGGGGAYTTFSWEFQPRPEIYGFEVLRADREEGPYRKLTAEPIAAINPQSGRQPVYRYRDENLIPGAVYYYAIEAIDLARNQNERISPVLRLIAIPAGQKIASGAN